jgi:PilZ domain
VFAGIVLDVPKQQKRSSPELHPEKELSMGERRNLDRKVFSYYMQLIDYDRQELVGHLADISPGGFKLDSLSPIPPNKDFRLRLDLTSEIANKSSMIFVARSKWCRVDPLDPFCYNVGFELINISPGDAEIFNRMIEKYGKEHENVRVDLRRSNKW